MKIFFDTLGCRLNQSEIERMAAQARLNGHEVVAHPSQAEIVVVNTCAVTVSACADSRKKIRHAARCSDARIIAAGCYAAIAPHEIADLPQVAWQVSNVNKEKEIQTILGYCAAQTSDSLQPRRALPGRQRRTRAFIKVQEGCDNFCTFCITRIARGKSRSQTMTEIYRDIQAALCGDAKEIVLTGVNLGAWGTDLEETPKLSSLIRNIINEFNPPRLRLSSLEPWDVDDDLIKVMQSSNFCRHLHLPLQSGSDSVLKRMARPHSIQEYCQLLQKIRKVFPQIAITTDIMVGFPGESEKEFLEGLEFVRSMKFAGGHVFNYSMRPGTPAAQLPGVIPVDERKRRSAVMRAVIDRSRWDYQSAWIGKQVSVLWEKADQQGACWRLEGLTDNYLRVHADAKAKLWNEFSQVLIKEMNNAYMKGDIVTLL